MFSPLKVIDMFLKDNCNSHYLKEKLIWLIVFFSIYFQALFHSNTQLLLE